MEQLTVQFTAKRREAFKGGHGYSIPVLKPSHILTPVAQQGGRARTWLSCRSADLMKRRTVEAMKRAGLDGYLVHEEDAALENVTIEPQGSGFMARVTVTINV